MGEPPILSEAHWVWPLVFFPYAIEHSHSWTFTGRRAVGGMKGALARVTLELSNDGLSVRGRLTGVAHLEIRAHELKSCGLLDGSPPLVEVEFAAAKWSRLSKVLVSRAPVGARDRVVLNVVSPTRWKTEIDRLIIDG